MLNPNDDVTDPSATRLREQREVELIAGIARGEVAALEVLYKQYYGKLFRFIVRTLGRTDVAGEIINDVMYVVWEKAGSFNGASRASTWIFGIAYNKARKFFGDQAAVTSLEALEVEPGDDRWSEQLERADLLARLFECLSPDHRLVLELTYYHGMHYREIAEVMGCPENTVKTRMFHARRRLGSLLDQALPDR